MSQVYHVYQHPKKGFWGFKVSDGKVSTVEIRVDSTVKIDAINAERLGPEVAKRLRTGYAKARRDGYLSISKNEDGQEIGRFVTEHPDLARASGEDLLLYTPLPSGLDLGALSEEWEERLEKVTGFTAKRGPTIDGMRRSESYLASFRDHPAMSLLIAQWAFDNKQELLSRTGRVPEKAPLSAMDDWVEYLGKYFDEPLVARTMDQLDLSIRAVLLGTAATSPEATVKINNETVVSEGWMADAERFLF